MNWVALDREQRSQHTLKVMVTDQGGPRLNATATVHILVTDVNDNAPQFTHLPASKQLHVQVSDYRQIHHHLATWSKYHRYASSNVFLLQIWAGLPAGSLVTNMFAKDSDAGENGTVTFSLDTGLL